MIKVRKSNPEDIKDLFEWRNDYLSRQMLLNSNKVKWENHKQWFEETLQSQNRLVLICTLKNNEKIGVVHFGLDKKIPKIAINLSSYYRGKGLSKYCLMESLEFFKIEFPNNIEILAEIKSCNIISQKLFKRCGFKFLKETGDLQYLIYHSY